VRPFRRRTIRKSTDPRAIPFRWRLRRRIEWGRHRLRVRSRQGVHPMDDSTDSGLATDSPGTVSLAGLSRPRLSSAGKHRAHVVRRFT
jgi:hypothetical protein